MCWCLRVCGFVGLLKQKGDNSNMLPGSALRASSYTTRELHALCTCCLCILCCAAILLSAARLAVRSSAHAVRKLVALLLTTFSSSKCGIDQTLCVSCFCILQYHSVHSVRWIREKRKLFVCANAKFHTGKRLWDFCFDKHNYLVKQGWNVNFASEIIVIVFIVANPAHST